MNSVGSNHYIGAAQMLRPVWEEQTIGAGDRLFSTDGGVKLVRKGQLLKDGVPIVMEKPEFSPFEKTRGPRQMYPLENLRRDNARWEDTAEAKQAAEGKKAADKAAFDKAAKQTMAKVSKQMPPGKGYGFSVTWQRGDEPQKGDWNAQSFYPTDVAAKMDKEGRLEAIETMLHRTRVANMGSMMPFKKYRYKVSFWPKGGDAKSVIFEV